MEYLATLLLGCVMGCSLMAWALWFLAVPSLVIVVYCAARSESPRAFRLALAAAGGIALAALLFMIESAFGVAMWRPDTLSHATRWLAFLTISIIMAIATIGALQLAYRPNTLPASRFWWLALLFLPLASSIWLSYGHSPRVRGPGIPSVIGVMLAYLVVFYVVANVVRGAVMRPFGRVLLAGLLSLVTAVGFLEYGAMAIAWSEQGASPRGEGWYSERECRQSGCTVAQALVLGRWCCRAH